MSRDNNTLAVQVIGTLAHGGAETVMHAACTGLSGRVEGLRFRILALCEADAFARRFEEAGIPVDCLHGDPRRPLRLLAGTMRYLREHRPAIVHTHLAYGDRFGQPASFLTGIGTRVSTLHNVKRDRTACERLTNRMTGRLAHAIVAVSESLRDTWISERGMPPKKLRVIYNSIPDPGMPRGGRRPGPHGRPPRLVCIANMRPVKGLVHAVDAMPRIAREHPGATLDIFGADTGGHGDTLRERIRRGQLAECVFLKGPTASAQAVLAAYDMALVPSLSEGFSIVVVEALAAGVPVIASDIAVHREILEDGHYGLIARVGDPSAIADAVNTLCADPDIYAALARGGAERARKYSRERMIAGYADLYRELAWRGGR
ncbi:MAG: glycosyltransferase [Chitinivibrionales bacterium]|nr:glycosyltransferase [Chitinivibrionales bacterium]MBD3395935.1 glycosyltransferase [Chitinivibrionales bacterium]